LQKQERRLTRENGCLLIGAIGLGSILVVGSGLSQEQVHICRHLVNHVRLMTNR
jgi:hypothetical protein